MRTILFQGKAINSDEWVEGTSIIRLGICFIHCECKELKGTYELIEVDPQSVGQYIGLDVKEKKIFEGNWIKFKHENQEEYEIAEVIYFGTKEHIGSYPSFDLNRDRIKNHYFEGNIISELLESDFEVEVVGNVFDTSIEELKTTNNQ